MSYATNTHYGQMVKKKKEVIFKQLTLLLLCIK